MSVPPESYFCYYYEVNEFPAHALADNAYHIYDPRQIRSVRLIWKTPK